MNAENENSRVSLFDSQGVPFAHKATLSPKNRGQKGTGGVSPFSASKNDDSEASGAIPSALGDERDRRDRGVSPRGVPLLPVPFDAGLCLFQMHHWLRDNRHLVGPVTGPIWFAMSLCIAHAETTDHLVTAHHLVMDARRAYAQTRRAQAA